MQTNSLPKVSVLIPAFNEEKTIYRVLTAVVGQDYPCFEIIVANNASTDRTVSIVQEFIDALPALSIRVILVHENRKGTNFAREAARVHAMGSVIAQLDADCLPAANWLRKGVSFLCTGKRVAVTGPYDYFDGRYWMRTSSLLTQQVIYPVINLLVQFAGKGAILVGGNALVRADLLHQIGGYNTELTFYGDDIALGKALSQYGHVYYAPALVTRSSSRRYASLGFWRVNKKYQACFWNLLFGNKPLDTLEMNHPR